MAKVKAPLFGTEARGRMGGLVYNTWRGINYVKAHTGPAQPRSQKVLQVRAYTAFLVRNWAILSADARLHWNQYAYDHPVLDTMNGTRRLTGANWYVMLNVRLLLLGYLTQSEPPTTAAPESPAVFAAADGVGQSILTWTAMGGTDKLVTIWAVGPHTKGRLAKIQMARTLFWVTGEAGTATVTGLRPGRHTFFVRTVDEDNGLVSTWVSDTADITPA